MTTLLKSVGDQGANQPDDVRTVQGLLNAQAAALKFALLPISGTVDAATLAAIRLVQSKLMQMPAPDGLISPGGGTWRTLIAGRAAGAAWWQANQARFPNSTALADLDPAFGPKAIAFIQALRNAGATVNISATRRSKVRAYLMHHSWDIAHGLERAAEVPDEPGCDIIWDHGDEARSRKGAQEMVDRFGIAFRPSLASRHIPGLAVDMTITWNGTLQVRNATGQTVAVPQPANHSNPVLHGVGASYGVIKLLTDPPHWSDNGH